MNHFIISVKTRAYDLSHLTMDLIFFICEVTGSGWLTSVSSFSSDPFYHICWILSLYCKLFWLGVVWFGLSKPWHWYCFIHLLHTYVFGVYSVRDPLSELGECRVNKNIQALMKWRWWAKMINKQINRALSFGRKCCRENWSNGKETGSESWVLLLRVWSGKALLMRWHLKRPGALELFLPLMYDCGIL